MKKRLLSMLMIVCMTISLLPIAGIKGGAVGSNDAQDVVDVANYYADISSTNWKNLCLGFVATCFNEAYGISSSPCCAYNYGSMYIDNTSRSDIPLGADVFFAGSDITCSGCGNLCGHVGIYVGDGNIIHSWSGRVQKSTIDYVVACGYPYRGYGWHGNLELTVSTEAELLLEKNSFTTSEHITFYFSNNNCTHKNLRIFRDGELLETLSTSDAYVTKTYTVPGEYSAYYDAVNDNSVIATSETVYFTVQGTDPGKPEWDGMKSSYAHDEEVVFNWTSTENTTYFDINIYDADTDALVKYIYKAPIGYAYGLPAGNYKAQVSAVNEAAYESDGTTFKHTESDFCYFTVEESPIVSGTCGEDVTWSLNRETGVMTISGTGAMESYTSTNNVPWKDYRDEIKSLVVKNGVTEIGQYAFWKCKNLSTVDCAKSVSVIASHAFQYSGLSGVLDIYASGGNLTLDSYAFADTEITRTKHVSFKKIDPTAFKNCASFVGFGEDDSVTYMSDNYIAVNGVLYKTDTGGGSTVSNVSELVCVPSGKTGTLEVFFTAASIGENAFIDSSLDKVIIDDNVKKIADNAFCNCQDLIIEFRGDVPEFSATAFAGDNTGEESTVTIYYPAGNDTWTDEITSSDFGGNLTWIPYGEVDSTISVTGITLSASTLDLTVGDTETLTATIAPADANNQNVVWSTSDASVATVANGKVTAVAAGTATITVTTEDGEKTASCMVTVQNAVDENAPAIVIDTVKSQAGKTVDVTVSLRNNPGLISMILNLSYDDDVLTLTKVADSGILGSNYHNPNLTKNPYTLSWGNDTATEDITANGTIVTFSFTVAEDAEVGTYPITITYDKEKDAIYNVSLKPVDFAVLNGGIEVIDFITGDVNNDGKVSTLDRTCLARYLADWDGYSENELNVLAMDVNNDGKVTTLDRTILARHLADWEGYEELPFIS